MFYTNTCPNSEELIETDFDRDTRVTKWSVPIMYLGQKKSQVQYQWHNTYNLKNFSDFKELK